MFANKDWLKETLVVTFLLGVVSTLVALFIVPFPYAYFVGVVIVILIVRLIHRRTIEG